MTNTTMTKTTYSCIGSVRGSCKHNHRTLGGAAQCLERDQNGCHSQGGYSDRRIVASDGVTVTTYLGDDGRLVAERDE